MTKIPEKNAPTAILFGGVNGAGKTSLYEIIGKTVPLGKRVSIDDIVKTEGPWQDPVIQVRAAKLAKNLIDGYIESGESFHFESTLTGMVVYRQLEEAKRRGFKTVLYFVGVDGYEKAIERVHRRVDRGGHGIDDRAVITRYNAMTENLRRISALCDEIYFFDNTVRFRQIAIHGHGRVLDEDPILPNWYKEVFK